MMRKHQPGGPTTHRGYLRIVENDAVRFRKLLRQVRNKREWRASGSMAKAERLAELIVRLARRGQKVPAAEAAVIVEIIIPSIDGLTAIIEKRLGLTTERR